MIKVYRYMSIKEFNLYSAGVEIVGKRYFRCRTNSTGVCFLPEHVILEGENSTMEFSPERCISFLRGIVNDEVLVEFVTDAAFTSSCGIYVTPYSDDWYDYVTVDELCIPSYSRDTFTATRYYVSGEWYKIF